MVAQQDGLVLQLASKCLIFHGSVEPSATDAQTHGESTSLPVLYTLIMTTRFIAVVVSVRQGSIVLELRIMVNPL